MSFPRCVHFGRNDSVSERYEDLSEESVARSIQDQYGILTVFSAKPIRNFPSRDRMINLLSVPTDDANNLTMFPIFLDVDCTIRGQLRSLGKEWKEVTSFPVVLAMTLSVSKTALTVRGFGLNMVGCLLLDAYAIHRQFESLFRKRERQPEQLLRDLQSS